MILIVLASVAVAIGRFLIPGHDLSWAGTYEAMAHIWVGVLLVFTCSEPYKMAFRNGEKISVNRFTAIICLASITVLEVVMFMLRKS